MYVQKQAVGQFELVSDQFELNGDIDFANQFVNTLVTRNEETILKARIEGRQDRFVIKGELVNRHQLLLSISPETQQMQYEIVTVVNSNTYKSTGRYYFTFTTSTAISGDFSTRKLKKLTFEGPNTLVQCNASLCTATSTFGDYNMKLRLVYLQGKTSKLFTL